MPVAVENPFENLAGCLSPCPPLTPQIRIQPGLPGGLAGGLEKGARMKNLTAITIKAAGDGRLQDGGGLMLDKIGAGGKWTYRYSIAGRRREMGLGAFPGVSLAQARAERDKWAVVLHAGLDPVTERQRRIAAEAAQSNEGVTLAELVDMVFEARKASLRGEGERGRWLSPLRIHVLPKLGKRRAGTLTQTDFRDVLAPIWRKKHETAAKCIQRLTIVFRQGRLAGLPVDPFTIEAARHLLGAVPQSVQHIPSTPWRDVPALFDKLGENPTTAHLCLRLIILTAVRGDAARGIRLEEIDGDVWTVPPDRIKGREGKVSAFRVPLSRAALDVIEACRHGAVDGILFPNRKRVGWGPISANAIEKALTTLGEPGRPHGLRTSFRSWVQDTQAASYYVAETALGHVVGNAVERSYARSDMLDQRRILADKWAAFVTGEAARVVQLRRDGA